MRQTVANLSMSIALASGVGLLALLFYNGARNLQALELWPTFLWLSYTMSLSFSVALFTIREEDYCP